MCLWEIFAGKIFDGLNALFRLFGLDKGEVEACVQVPEAPKGATRVSLPVEDRVRRRHDPTFLALTEDGVEACDGSRWRGHEVAEDVAGPDGGQLIRIADEQEMGPRGNCLKEVRGKSGVEHAGLVED